jgi:hypothetical protein
MAPRGGDRGSVMLERCHHFVRHASGDDFTQVAVFVEADISEYFDVDVYYSTIPSGISSGMYSTFQGPPNS